MNSITELQRLLFQEYGTSFDIREHDLCDIKYYTAFHNTTETVYLFDEEFFLVGTGKAKEDTIIYLRESNREIPDVMMQFMPRGIRRDGSLIRPADRKINMIPVNNYKNAEEIND